MHIHYIQKMHSVSYKMVDISKLNMHNIVFQNDGWWTSKNNLHTLTRYNLNNWKTEQRFEQRKCFIGSENSNESDLSGEEGAMRNIITKSKSLSVQVSFSSPTSVNILITFT